MTQCVVVIQVFTAQRDRDDSLQHQRFDRVFRGRLTPGIAETGGKPRRQPYHLVGCA